MALSQSSTPRASKFWMNSTHCFNIENSLTFFKVASTLQSAGGFCVSCGLSEHHGVSRQCRVCLNTYCGRCKSKRMIKSNSGTFSKKKRWYCRTEPCKSKGERQERLASSVPGVKTPPRRLVLFLSNVVLFTRSLQLAQKLHLCLCL